jgi:hypothetical protein
MILSWTTFADSAFSRRWNVRKSWCTQIVRTPAGDTPDLGESPSAEFEGRDSPARLTTPVWESATEST